MKKTSSTYETISSTFSSLSISNNNSFFNVTKCLEKLSQRFVRSMVRQAPHENFREGCVFLLYVRSRHQLLLHNIGHIRFQVVIQR